MILFILLFLSVVVAFMVAMISKHPKKEATVTQIPETTVNTKDSKLWKLRNKRD